MVNFTKTRRPVAARPTDALDGLHQSAQGQHGQTINGFSLFELLVVIAVIAIMSTVAMLSLGGGETRLLSKEARRMQNLLQLAVDEAQLEGQTLGVAFGENTLQWLQFNYVQGLWFEWGEDFFAPHQLPEGWRFNLLGENQAELFEQFELEEFDLDSDDKKEEAIKLYPDIVILPDGEVTPFELGIEATTQQAWLLVEDGLKPDWTLRYETD